MDAADTILLSLLFAAAVAFGRWSALRERQTLLSDAYERGRIAGLTSAKLWGDLDSKLKDWKAARDA